MKRTIATLSVFAATGCAGSYTYTPPPLAPTASNSVTVYMPKDAAWKVVVSNLASSFFVINNLDKDSGFINLSYSGDPEKYVTCGTIYSKVSSLRGTREYKIPASRSAYQYERMEAGTLYGFERTVDLDGRINVLLEELDPSRTLVTANVRYGIVIQSHTSTRDGQPPRSLTQSKSFNTNGSVKFPAGTICRPTGILEDEIMALASPG